MFGATDYDLVHYVSYRDRLGLITAPGPIAGGLSDFWQREFGILGEMGPDRGAGSSTPSASFRPTAATLPPPGS